MIDAKNTLAAVSLEPSDEIRVLRRLSRRKIFNPTDGTPIRTGVVLDIETTGLNHATDEIIELGMLKFTFSSDGRIFNVVDEFSSFSDPGAPIPPAVTELTGITTEMVSGKSIDAADVATFIADAVLVIAHSAAFDRPFCEKLLPAFCNKYWACSNSQVNWPARGHRGTKLTYLLNDFGLFYEGHRAVDDCYAVLEVLSSVLPPSVAPPFSALLENARKTSVRIWAVGAPFEHRDALKARGYRWSDGNGGSVRAWWTDLDQDAIEAEVVYLREAFFANQPVDFPTRLITGLDRFSVRA